MKILHRNRASDMAISEAELSALTRDLDAIHHDTFGQVNDAVEDLASRLRTSTINSPLNRRHFLIAGAALGGSAALAACSSSSSSSKAAPVTTQKPTQNVDLVVATLAAGLENLAVKTYQGALDAATAGKLGTVPPAVAEFAKTAMSQHRDHAGVWNAVLTKAGHQKVTGIDTTVDKAVVQPAFAKVKGIGDVAALALELEDVAAATYLNGVQNALTEASAIKLAMTIQPVEMQHSAILNLITGKYPVPSGFAQTTGARPVTDKVA